MYKSLYTSHIRVNPVKRMSKSHHTQSIRKIMYVNYSLVAIRKSRHRHLGISISIDVGIGIGIAKTLFYFAKSLFLPFEVLYEETSMLKYFSSTLAGLPV